MRYIIRFILARKAKQRRLAEWKAAIESGCVVVRRLPRV